MQSITGTEDVLLGDISKVYGEFIVLSRVEGPHGPETKALRYPRFVVKLAEDVLFQVVMPRDGLVFAPAFFERFRIDVQHATVDGARQYYVERLAALTPDKAIPFYGDGGRGKGRIFNGHDELMAFFLGEAADARQQKDHVASSKEKTGVSSRKKTPPKPIAKSRSKKPDGLECT